MSLHHHPRQSPGMSEERQIRVPFTDVLPPELTMCILDHLTTASDTNSVRLVSRSLRSAAWPAFSRSFNKRIFFPTDASMKALTAVSQQKEMRPYITKICVAPLSFSLDDNEYGETVSNRLAVAMHALPGLRTLVVVDPGTLPARYSFSPMLRFWPDRIHVVRPERHSVLYDQGLNMLVDASEIAQSLGSSIDSIESLGEIDISALRQSCSRRNPLGPPIARLAHITRLELKLRLSSKFIAGSTSRFTSTLPTFLEGMPNLTHLNLAFPEIELGDTSTLPGRIENRVHDKVAMTLYGLAYQGFSAQAIFKDPSWNLYFPKLAYLQLANLDLRSTTFLETFLTKHASSLQQLSLRRVALSRESALLSSLSWNDLYSFLARTMNLEVFELIPFRDEKEYLLAREEWDDEDEDEDEDDDAKEVIKMCARVYRQVWWDGEIEATCRDGDSREQLNRSGAR